VPAPRHGSRSNDFCQARGITFGARAAEGYSTT
jgi:hypothetical protein